MYTNIGKKIKSLAVVICIVFIVLSVLIGLVAMAYDDKLIPIALLAVIAAALISWLSSFVLYGFGELVENSAKIAAQKSRNIAFVKQTHISRMPKHTDCKNSLPKGR